MRYGDGRTMCNRCRRTAIDQPKDGVPVLTEVRHILARLGVNLGDAPTPLRLVDQSELNRLSTKAYARQPTGMVRTRTWTENDRVTWREIEEILILHGLPREHFAASTAHELGHAWLFLNAFPELPPPVEEGLCELCEYLWLKQQYTPEATYRLHLMEDNDDPVYGRGFQVARRELERLPLSALFTFVRTHRRFP